MEFYGKLPTSQKAIQYHKVLWAPILCYTQSDVVHQLSSWNTLLIFAGQCLMQHLCLWCNCDFGCRIRPAVWFTSQHSELLIIN